VSTALELLRRCLQDATTPIAARHHASILEALIMIPPQANPEMHEYMATQVIESIRSSGGKNDTHTLQRIVIHATILGMDDVVHAVAQTIPWHLADTARRMAAFRGLVDEYIRGSTALTWHDFDMQNSGHETVRALRLRRVAAGTDDVEMQDEDVIDSTLRLIFQRQLIVHRPATARGGDDAGDRRTPQFTKRTRGGVHTRRTRQQEDTDLETALAASRLEAQTEPNRNDRVIGTTLAASRLPATLAEETPQTQTEPNRNAAGGESVDAIWDQVLY
jgi:hypothetical protein